MGILGRAKEIAGEKVSSVKKGIAKEGRYQEYKNPDVAYITKGRNKSEDYEETSEFSERKAKEQERNAARRAAIKAKARYAAGNVKTKLQAAMKEKPRRAPARQQNDSDIFGFGGGGMGKGFDPIGFGGGRKAVNPLGFGGKRKQKFSLF